MKNDFLIAITQLSAEKNLPREVVFEAVEAALASAYKKDSPDAGNVVVKIDPVTGNVAAYNQRLIVEEVTDPKIEIGLPEAREHRPDATVGESVDFEFEVKDSGRIAAQTAKQVVLQKLREAEREVVFEEYADKEGDILAGVVQRVEPKQVIVDLGKTEALLPISEQVRVEHYHSGQRLKVYLLEVSKALRGPQVIVSRTHKNLIRRLFELEVPEIFRGTVELKSIAREPGYRSKVAVAARQEGVDPVGACVGLRGIRIQNIVNELNGERVDVVQWDPDPARFVANALSPAQVVSVVITELENTAAVTVPDRQLSLAIGKEGQNARLAAKLTGWRIDIKSQSAAEQEEHAEPQAGLTGMIAEPEPFEADEPRRQPTRLAPEPSGTEEETFVEPAAVQAVEMPAAQAGQPAPVAAAPSRPLGPRLRFAEDLSVPPLEPAAPARGDRAAPKRGGRKGPATDEEVQAAAAAAAARAKRSKRGTYVPVDEEDEDEDQYAYLTPRR